MDKVRVVPTSGEVVVLGAGIAGLSAADILARRGYSVQIIDRTDRCGGAHRSHQIGPYTFDAGSIFYEEAARIFEFAPDLRDLCPPARRVQRRIGMDGCLLHYPIQPSELLTWSNVHLLHALASLVNARFTRNSDGTLEAMCLARLGPMIFERTGLRSYVTRFHHVPASEIDECFFALRMGFLEKATRSSMLLQTAIRMLLRKPFRRGPPARLRIRPAEGFDAIFDPVRTSLERRGVRFVMGEAVERIERTGTEFTVRTSSRTLHAETVVATVPLDTTYRALFGCGTELRSLDLLTLFVSASYLHADAGNVLYNFHTNGRWKRMTVYSRLYPDMMQTREFFSVEVTLPPSTQCEPNIAFSDLEAHLQFLGLASDMRLEGFDCIDSSYPLYDLGSGARLAKVLSKVTEAGIVTAGRQGRFEYLPTSSGVIRRVADELTYADLARVELSKPRIQV